MRQSRLTTRCKTIPLNSPKSAIMNLTISSLCLGSVLGSPSFAGVDRLSLSNSKFRHHFHPVIFNSRVSHVSLCSFSKFLAAAIRIEDRRIVTGYSSLWQSVSDSELVIKQALFDHCASESGCIFFKVDKGICSIDFSIFTLCSSRDICGAFYLDCSSVTISELGINNCVASHQCQAFSISADTADVAQMYVHRCPGDVVGRGPCQNYQVSTLKMRSANHSMNLIYDTNLAGYYPNVCLFRIDESFDIGYSVFSRCQATSIVSCVGPVTGSSVMNECNFVSNRPYDTIFSVQDCELSLIGCRVSGEMQILVVLPPRTTLPPTSTPIVQPSPPPTLPPAIMGSAVKHEYWMTMRARPLLTQDQLFRFQSGGSAYMKDCQVVYEFPTSEQHLIKGDNVASMFSITDVQPRNIPQYGDIEYSHMYASLIADWGGVLIFSCSPTEIVVVALLAVGIVFFFVYMLVQCFCRSSKSDALLE